MLRPGRWGPQFFPPVLSDVPFTSNAVGERVFDPRRKID